MLRGPLPANFPLVSQQDRQAMGHNLRRFSMINLLTVSWMLAISSAHRDAGDCYLYPCDHTLNTRSWSRLTLTSIPFIAISPPANCPACIPTLNMAPYTGTSRRLVLAFDVGTTFSAVAYCVLGPGIEPQIQTINRYPGQGNGDCKIPTVLYYTQKGKIRAVGAEAMTNTMRLMEEDEELMFVEWFKLLSLKDSRPCPLPPGKSAEDVFTDFLGYLYECARRFVTETHANGEKFWDSLRDSTEIILTHPNGWGGLQQDKMRAATLSINDIALGHARVSFVTEGEASLHYCLQSVAVQDAIQTGNNIMIIDAGEGTIGISTYTFTNATSPITVEEIAPPGCIIEGSIYVTLRAQEFLLAKLRDSRYGNEEDFGSTKDKDFNVGIRSGQLVVDGADMAQFFEPSISAILEAVAEQVKAGKDYDIKTAFLVSRYPDLIRQPTRQWRKERILRSLEKGPPVEKTSCFGTLLWPIGSTKCIFGITCERDTGESKNPCWIDEEPDMFSILCTVEADTSKVVKTKAKGAHGPYYRVSFKLILICGMTEMSAQIGWSHNNHEFRGPAKIVYHDY
ncbi:hypothetical protein ABKN59_000920 [Abortiporus biennis]